MIFRADQRLLAGYHKRNKNREITVKDATMALVAYYMGQPISDDLATANDKVDQIGDYLFENHAGAIFGYIWGIKRQKTKLIAAINGMDEAAFPHFDTAAKKIVTDKLKRIT